MTPIMGSLIASHRLEINMITEHAAAGRSMVSVINGDIKVAATAAMIAAGPYAEVA